MNAIDRLDSKIATSNGCWMWTGAIGGHGYGNVRWEGRTLRPHRVVYELLVGPIPEGLVIDHLCGVKTCVNPAHLEPVTGAENTRRVPMWANAVKTHCPAGHPYEGTNLALYGRGHRRCRQCNAAAARRYRSRRPR